MKNELTSGELIDALKSGNTLRFDVYQKGEDQWQYIIPYDPENTPCTNFYLTGWGSAIGTADDRILHIISNPERYEVFSKALNQNEK